MPTTNPYSLLHAWHVLHKWHAADCKELYLACRCMPLNRFRLFSTYNCEGNMQDLDKWQCAVVVLPACACRCHGMHAGASCCCICVVCLPYWAQSLSLHHHTLYSFCSVQTHQMEDTIIGLNSLVSLMCAANEAVLSVVHVGKALAQLSRMHIHSSCCHVDPDCIAH